MIIILNYIIHRNYPIRLNYVILNYPIRHELCNSPELSNIQMIIIPEDDDNFSYVSDISDMSNISEISNTPNNNNINININDIKTTEYNIDIETMRMDIDTEDDELVRKCNGCYDETYELSDCSEESDEESVLRNY